MARRYRESFGFFFTVRGLELNAEQLPGRFGIRRARDRLSNLHHGIDPEVVRFPASYSPGSHSLFQESP